MRATRHLLAAVEAELARCADKKGAALMTEYCVAVARMERFVNQMDYSQHVLNRVSDCARRLKNWLEGKVKERTEFVRKDDA